MLTASPTALNLLASLADDGWELNLRSHRDLFDITIHRRVYAGPRNGYIPAVGRAQSPDLTDALSTAHFRAASAVDLLEVSIPTGPVNLRFLLNLPASTEPAIPTIIRRL